MTASQIRQTFLDFFQQKGHQIVPSAPIVVKNDPTLLFINSGMAPFKDAFLGNKAAPASRIADTQKCLRVSGKHNDLEEVGVDTYHHTLFEMLGNWSFGDYFKKEAIAWAWELLTKVYKIPKEQLYVTVFGGDETECLSRDEEALNLWKTHIDDSRILFGSKKDNFWEMGDTGPCGPCTEIHVDCRSEAERADGLGGTLVNADHPQVIEIWNLVFMQYNRLKDASLQALPAQHVDTGMGFERLVRVLQGKQSNYDTDIFSGTISKIESISNHQYTATDSKVDIAFRVLADHVRAIAFTIADGQLPSNTGAGYVIRRILRRAVRYYYSYLDYKHPLIHQLIPVLATQFAPVFPELDKQVDFVSKVVKEEEEAFLRTLERGLKRLDELIATAPATLIEGQSAFELFDTYGFPIDLTRLVASEKGYTVDEVGFEKGLAEQKTRSRAATALDTEDWIILKEGNSRFVGYDTLESTTHILRYRKAKAKGKESFQIVLAETPFYAESGGQVGDKGELKMPAYFSGKQNAKCKIVDTKKENDLIIHFTERLPEDLSGVVIATVDKARRAETEVHHSATHLLHAALRKVLGTHVAQKGSLVDQEHLRFDFSHFAKMSDEEIAEVERIVNAKIRENVPVIIKTMSKDEAVTAGAMALFGEKYGEVVRVVIMDPEYSLELCGGTHVGRTGDLGFFKIKSEAAVAAGVRRIEAVSGLAAESMIQAELLQLQEAREALKNPKDLGKAVSSLQEDTNALRKKLEAVEARQLATLAEELAQKSELVNGVNFIGASTEVSSMDALRKLAADTLRKVENGVVVLTSVINEKASVAIAISEAQQARGMDANKLIKEVVAPLIKGGGGGQKSLATAGGTEVRGLGAVIGKIKELL
ncbi:MAG: alanine--tRNA ligase [Chitinophagaceae bacterium]